jgi:hypothetical protein
MTEEPYVAEGYHNPILRPTFSSKFLQVYREEEAFPFSSLVADCGGILGMFIGFNSELHRRVILTEYRRPKIFVHEKFPNTEDRRSSFLKNFRILKTEDLRS